ENIADVFWITADVTENGWKTALSGVEQELRRTRIYGFTQAEIDEHVAIFRETLERAVVDSEKSTNRAYAARILHAEREGLTLTDAMSGLKRFDSYAESITPAAVHAAFNEMWSGAEPLIFLTSELPVE